MISQPTSSFCKSSQSPSSLSVRMWNQKFSATERLACESITAGFSIPSFLASDVPRAPERPDPLYDLLVFIGGETILGDASCLHIDYRRDVHRARLCDHRGRNTSR